MNKEIALKLQDKIKEVADLFSKDREFNYSNDKFVFLSLKPLSETTACAIYEKTSGKKAIAFFYYLVSQGGHWRYFFPTESHTIGMSRMSRELILIDEYNINFNFIKKE